jgi:cytochrome P450
MEPQPSETGLYDPHSPELQASLYETYRVLRDRHPVYHNPRRRIWLVSRYDDVMAVLRDAETFSSADVEEARLLMPMIVFMDGARHRAMRSILSSVFTPRRVTDLEPRIREATRELLRVAAREPACEFMHAVAAQLPSIVICELIGIPEDRRQAFIAYTECMIETGPNATPLHEPAGKIYAEFLTLLAERRKQPRDDLMSALLTAEIDGERLSEQELLGFCFNLIIGGTDTTMNLIGNGTTLLAQHPDQRKILAEDPGRVPDAVEEMLRIESPTQTLPRRPTRDVEMHGVVIPADCRLLVSFGAANHDERVFDDPERFDIDRDLRTTRHLAFGNGAHHCLGSSLARLEARIAFEELLAGYPDYRIRE